MLSVFLSTSQIEACNNAIDNIRRAVRGAGVAYVECAIGEYGRLRQVVCILASDLILALACNA